MKNRIKITLAFGIIIIILVPNSNLIGASSIFSSIQVYRVDIPHRASQGVATNGHYLYLTTSINESQKRENIISIYDMNGSLLMERRNASNATDPDGRDMDFGDGSVINGQLYIALYNWHSLGAVKHPLYSKILMFDTNNLTLISEYDIGGNTAEGIAYHSGYFWVTFHDEPIIKKFNKYFRLIETYKLEIPPEVKTSNGYFQGLIWYGNDILANIHGPNNDSSYYSPGIIRYHFNGSNFRYVETILPPTYGSGQGIDIFKDNFYFVDRPANTIIKAHLTDIY